MEILHIEDLSFKYSGSSEQTLNGISFYVKRGEFIVICGSSGCGKTTLLKLLKPELTPAGEKTGTMLYSGEPLESIPQKRSAAEIGFVMQNPDSQIVTDKVWHELAFGLENLGVPSETIRRRVGEMASYFGITGWFRKKTSELSGGQKQILSLASVMAANPKVLILDEPTGQLDPVAASDFIATLQKLNRELGLTVILVEHRLEEAFPAADRVMLMENGKITAFDKPENISDRLKAIKKDHPMTLALPSAVRIFNSLGHTGKCPLSVKEGRSFLEENYGDKKAEYRIAEYTHRAEKAVELKDVWFRYEKTAPDVLCGTGLTVYDGEMYCILGGNGSGKTTLLNVVSGIDRQYKGKVYIFGRRSDDYKRNSLYRGMLSYLPQDPLTVFVKDSVRAELLDMMTISGVSKDEAETRIADTARRFGIEHLLSKHPYDLSGGEQQKCALAKILIPSPKLLLLDEPTKGLDAYYKSELKKTLRGLIKNGMTVIAVTHDVEFAAENADRCGLFFDGDIISSDVPERFFSENNFYTTAANRMARELFPHAISCESVVAVCRGETR